MYGPKGVGFLYVRKDHPNLKLEPIMFGGTQEKGLRPGTHNVPGIVGLGKACELCLENMLSDKERIRALQEKLISDVLKLSSDIVLNGPRENRLYTNVSFTFKNLNADVFALGLSGLAVSTSSACSGGAPSHVLKALGHSDSDARSTVRFGLGRFTKESDIDTAIEKISNLIANNSGL
jgi:cysteine desulfurase